MQTGVTVLGATGYQWNFTSPTAPPPKPERLVQASSATLNPGAGNYTVTLRYRTTKHFGNIVQKGQAGSAGGYFKLENPSGRLNCVFRGVSSSGAFLRKAVESGVISNGAWHLVVCTRTPSGLTLTVDGKRRRDREGQHRHDLELAADHHRRQAQLRSGEDDVRLLHRQHRLHQDRELAQGRELAEPTMRAWTPTS